jgi:SNF2 family DNA or RNA helicase
MIKLSPLTPKDHRHILPPMAHQQAVFNASRDLPYYGIWWEMGTGKSKLLIDTIAWLYLNREIDGVIIISDKGAYLNWPVVELPKHLMPEIPARIVTYRSGHNNQELVGSDDILDIVVMNVEAFSGDRAKEYANKFIDTHHTLMAIDESTSIKSIKSQRTKNLIALGRRCDYRRILTGTPLVHSPLDAYSQCEFLSQGALGHSTYTGFRREYAEMRTMTFGSRCFQQVVGYRNLDKLSEKLRSFSSRILKYECLDLPEKVYEIEYVEHTPEQQKMYEDLKTFALSQHEQGLLTVTSAITTVNKLHQISCGHVKLDDGTTVDVPSNRIKSLLSLLERINGKVVIWCAFQRDVELIYAELESLKSGYPVHYYGNTSYAERIEAIRAFKEDPECFWFVGTAATGGKGIDLTVANYEIYYSNSDSAEDRWQSEDRCHRKGQDRKVTILDLVTPSTVDVKILQRLRRKEALAYQVLDKFRDILAG